MGDPKGFMKIARKEAGNRPVRDRILDFGEVEQTLNTEDRKLQATRCMDCGIPFCHWACPVINIIPEWQELLHKGEWKKAIDLLHSTNNFPEFTGRICPAPCEDACVLTLHEAPVTIRENEAAIVEMAFREGYIRPVPPVLRSDKKVAVIGSGPAGLACADQMNKMGHSVVLFEKEDAAGGLLRYGIPDFKLNKQVIDRRLDILVQEGITIQTNIEVGRDISISELVNQYDAVCISIGAEEPRDLRIEGRDLEGIHFAMEFLKQQNKLNRGLEIPYDYHISAKDKNVVVIGGGDTGSDCVGTSIRQGAASVSQFEILPMPLKVNGKVNPNWPNYPGTLKTSSSHEEGCERRWSVSTTRFFGEKRLVTGLELCQVEWKKDDQGRMEMQEVPETLEIIKADLILLATGFVHPVHSGMISDLKLDLDNRGNIVTGNDFRTNHPKVFAAGDARVGASLVVKAIYSGRQAAEHIDNFLSKT